MKYPIHFTALLAVASMAHPALAAPKPHESWGRAGVTLETYREDAQDCAATAYYADISETEHAQAFRSASRRLEAADDSSAGQAGATSGDDMYRMVDQASRAERIRRSIRPEKRMRELKLSLQEILETCLMDRGYVKFRLTDEQRSYLGTLQKGSEHRRIYLHSLASSQAVLEQQGIGG